MHRRILNRGVSLRFSIRQMIVSVLLLIAVNRLPVPSAHAGIEGQASGVLPRPGTQKDAPPLELNQPIERQIDGNQAHEYRINLAAGQYIRVEVSQEAIDAHVELYDDEGKQEVIAVRDAKGPLKEILETVIEKT